MALTTSERRAVQHLFQAIHGTLTNERIDPRDAPRVLRCLTETTDRAVTALITGAATRQLTRITAGLDATIRELTQRRDTPAAPGGW